MDQTYRVGTDVHVLPSQLPVPGVGTIPINAFVLMSERPGLVDCGLGVDADAFVDALGAVVDPADLEWIWLTHDDADHTGSLRRILDLAPRARLVTHGFSALRQNAEWAVPLDRVMAVAPGDRLDAGDRMLRAVRPPTYDNPMSTGIFDESTATFFAVDSFGAILPTSPSDLDALADDVLVGGMTAWATFDSPWLHLADRDRLARYLDGYRDLGAERVLSSHLPPAIGRIDRLLDFVASIPDAEPFIPPDATAFDTISGRPRRQLGIRDPRRRRLGPATGKQHDVVHVVLRRCGPGAAGSLLVHLDVPARRARDHRGDVVDPEERVGIERAALLVGVDRGPHRLEIVADHQQRASRRDRTEQVVRTPAVGRARDRRVVRGDEVERSALERLERVGVDVAAVDVQSAARGFGGDPVEGRARCRSRSRSIRAPLARPRRRPRPRRRRGPDRRSRRRSRRRGSRWGCRSTAGRRGSAGPSRLRSPTAGPRRAMSSSARLKLIMAPTRLPSAAAAETCWLGSVTLPAAYRPGDRCRAGRVDGLDEVAETGRVRRGRESESGERLGPDPEPRADRHRVRGDAAATGQLDRGDVPVGAGDDAPRPARRRRRPRRPAAARARRVGVDPGRAHDA